ncbi:MAG: hypothetical protein LUQ65_07955 [Candidatus Helarchaeota archaeon]|nr:hypothetical protein [Candidatus Helarchaeota archaeon]
MLKKIKIGIIFMLVGIGIPSALMFFQKDGELFNLKIAKQDKLREAEVKTLNSLYNLSKSLDETEPTLTTEEVFDKKKPFEFYESLLKKKIDKVNNEIKALMKEAEFPMIGRMVGKETVPPPPQDFVIESPERLGKFVYLTPINITIGIPFRYSVGVGLIFFLTGIGFVALPLIGKKQREQQKKEEKKDV